MEFQVGDEVQLDHHEDVYGMNTFMEDWLRRGTVLSITGVFGGRIRVGGPEGAGASVCRGNIQHLDGKTSEERKQAKEKAHKEALSRVPDLIEEAKKAIRDSEDKGHNGIAVHLKAGAPIKVNTGPCHGFIRNDGSKDSLAIVSRLVREENLGSNDRYRRQQSIKHVLPVYYDWLFNRSPWAFCYETKDADKALEEKCVVVRTDVPANLLQGALISTRNTWEYERNILLWHELTQKHGINEHLAFVCCYMVSYSKGDGEVVLNPMGGDHIAISVFHMSFEGVKAFLNNAPVHQTGAYNEGGTYSGVTAAFTDGSDEFRENFRGDFNSFSLHETSLKLNPFEKAKKAAGGPEKVMDVTTFAAFIKQKVQNYIK